MNERERIFKLIEMVAKLQKAHQKSDVVSIGTLFKVAETIGIEFQLLDEACKKGNLPNEWHSGIKFCQGKCKMPLPKGYGPNVCIKCRFSSRSEEPT
jgi:hypothetical protein